MLSTRAKTCEVHVVFPVRMCLLFIYLTKMSLETLFRGRPGQEDTQLHKNTITTEL